MGLLKQNTDLFMNPFLLTYRPLDGFYPHVTTCGCCGIWFIIWTNLSLGSWITMNIIFLVHTPGKTPNMDQLYRHLPDLYTQGLNVIQGKHENAHINIFMTVALKFTMPPQLKFYHVGPQNNCLSIFSLFVSFSCFCIGNFKLSLKLPYTTSILS